MKKAALALMLVLVLTSMIVEAELAGLGEVYATETQPHFMSFEEAIEAANTKTYDEPLIIFLMNGRGVFVEPQGEFLVDESANVSGFLMWLASNGTFYEAEYPSGVVLEEIGHTHDQEGWIWNASDPSYIWYLYHPESSGEWSYWLFANNGTIIFEYFEPRRFGPVPTPPNIAQEIFFGALLAISVAVMVAVLTLVVKKIIAKKRSIEPKFYLKLFYSRYFISKIPIIG